MKGSSANKIEQFINELHFFKRRSAVTVISKLAVLSGGVRRVCMVRRAQRPSPVSLQPPIKVIASILLFRPMPQLPLVHLSHSQVQRTVHLWTREGRTHNTLQNTVPPSVWQEAKDGALVTLQPATMPGR